MKIFHVLSVQFVGSIILLPLVMTPPSVAASALGGNELVSISNNGARANLASNAFSLSDTGNVVAFASAATNLVPGDTNGFADIFVRDRGAGKTERVSISSSGAQADENSFNPSISADGRYVAFESFASNLVPGDTNGKLDVFVHDRQTGTTQRVSVSSSGEQGNGDSRNASISADGRYLAFSSDASNLVSGDTNAVADVFIRDLLQGTTERVSLASDGSQANDVSDNPAITPDGRFVAFASFATNLVGDDTNGVSDVFVRDRQTGKTERVSLFPGNKQSVSDSTTPAISADGRYVAFASHNFTTTDPALNGLLQIYLRDRQTGTTQEVSVSASGSEGNQNSFQPTLSADGRFIAFVSNAWNLVDGDTNNTCDVFVRDLVTGQIQRVSLAANGNQANGASDMAVISGDGKVIGFRSDATDLVTQKMTDGVFEIYTTDNPEN